MFKLLYDKIQKNDIEKLPLYWREALQQQRVDVLIFLLEKEGKWGSLALEHGAKRNYLESTFALLEVGVAVSNEACAWAVRNASHMMLAEFLAKCPNAMLYEEEDGSNFFHILSKSDMREGDRCDTFYVLRASGGVSLLEKRDGSGMPPIAYAKGSFQKLLKGHSPIDAIWKEVCRV